MEGSNICSRWVSVFASFLLFVLLLRASLTSPKLTSKTKDVLTTYLDPHIIILYHEHEDDNDRLPPECAAGATTTSRRLCSAAYRVTGDKLEVFLER